MFNNTNTEIQFLGLIIAHKSILFIVFTLAILELDRNQKKINQYFREPDYDSFQKDLEVIDIIKDREVHLFEFSPIKGMSLVEYFSKNYKYIHNHIYDYVYTIKSLKLTKEMVAEIVRDSFFQLGRSAIVLSELNEEAVLNLMICWTDERPLAGIEMIRLDYDGDYLLFYNMKDNKKLQHIIDNHN